MTEPRAFYSAEHQVWYIPCHPDMHKDFVSIEPVRLELKDDMLHITILEDLATPNGAGKTGQISQ